MAGRAEPFTAWFLEDEFTSGRPPLENAGVNLVPDVRPYELMKLRLLNAAIKASRTSATLPDTAWSTRHARTNSCQGSCSTT